MFLPSVQVIQKWRGIELQDNRIYSILLEVELSHQKDHPDYLNANPERQGKTDSVFSTPGQKSPLMKTVNGMIAGDAVRTKAKGEDGAKYFADLWQYATNNQLSPQR